MKKTLLFTSLLCIMSIFTVKAQVSQAEFDALVAFYNATNGDSWTDNSNWDITATKDDVTAEWKGIMVSNGHVINLNLSSNNLTGTLPDELGDLEYLKTLYLQENEISGSIPTSIGNLTEVTFLSLNNNQLTGIVPTEIGSLTVLRSLDLSNNSLSGTIPSAIENMTELSGLHLNNNNLSGAIPPEIYNSEQLTGLYLYDNELTGNISSQIGNLSSLKFLDLKNNELTGSIPSQIGNLSSLKFLKLENNNLTGNIPSEIENLYSLTILDLDNNKLDGNIPSGIGNLTELRQLSFSDNNISGTIPESIGDLSLLYSFYADNNNLSGEIPTAIGNLTSLQYLYLNTNILTGSIPKEIGNLINARGIKLDGNQLTGSIPSEIGNLTNMTFFYVSDNNLSGHIPEEIGNLIALTFLYLDNNQLTGEVPSQIQAITGLKYLLIKDNQITGLPNLTALPLTTFELQNNKLTFGDIETNMPVINGNYSPQAKVGNEQHLYAAIGSDIIISVNVDGNHNTYQWYFGTNTLISGAENASYTISNFELADERTYYCKIQNTVATALTLQSNDIVISSSAIPVITAQPETLDNFCVNATASFSIEDNYAETYQWQEKSPTGSWQNISDATDWTGYDTQSISSVQANIQYLDGYSYRCIVTNPNGSETSTAAILNTDAENPELTVQDFTLELDATGNATLQTTDVVTSASDNCTIDETTLSKTAFDCSNIGTPVTIDVTATDISGNSITKQSTITVVDNIDPEFDVNNHTLELDENGEATLLGANVSSNTTDNCSISSIALSKKNFDCLNIGTPEVIDVTLADVNGNETTKQATITVVDNIDPALSVQNFTIELDATGNATLKASDVVTNASDNCSIADTTLSLTAFDCSNTETPVTIDVTLRDASGNETTKQVTITVEDNVDPVLSVQNYTLQLDATGNASLKTLYVVTDASDNCELADTTLSQADFDCANVGTPVTVDVTLIDKSGNETTEQVVITIEDNVNPQFDVNNHTLELDENGEATLLGSNVSSNTTDNCSISSIALSKKNFDCSNIGTPEVIDVTLADVNENETTKQSTITVVDNIDPLLNVQNFTIELDATGNATLKASDVVTNASDNCSIADTTLNQMSFDCSNIGTPISVDITLSDESGNETTKQATITTVDNVDPILTVQNHTLQLNEDGNATLKLSDVVLSTSDNCGIADTTLSLTDFDCSHVGASHGVYVRLYDNAGNYTDKLTSIYVVDNINPEIISTHNDKTITDEGNCEATLPDYTGTVIVSDNCDGDLNVTQFPVPGTIISGQIPVTLTATDDSGNEADVTFNLYVDDITNPELTVKDFTLQLDNQGKATLFPADVVTRATDNCTLADTILSKSEFDCSNINAPVNVNVTLSDHTGNEVNEQVTITVEDNINPILSVQNHTIYIDENGSATLALKDVVIDATDNCSIADTTLSQTNFDCANIGTPVNVDVTLTDANGNSVTEIVNISISDTLKPVVPTLADITDECSATITVPTTTDNCAGTITTTTDDPLTYDAQGEYVITWNFDDGNGNNIDVVQNVIIEDITKPTIQCRADTTINLSQGESTFVVNNNKFDPISTDDNCTVASVSNDFNNSASLKDAELPIGTTTITWTVTDNAGNIDTCSYNVIVNLASGINNTISSNGIKVYPNPSNGIFNIEFESKSSENVNIEILSIDGKKLYKDNHICSDNINIDLSAISKGMYFVKLSVDKRIIIKRIVVE